MGNCASLTVKEEERTPLFLSDIQHLLMYSMLGHHSPYQPSRWQMENIFGYWYRISDIILGNWNIVVSCSNRFSHVVIILVVTTREQSFIFVYCWCYVNVFLSVWSLVNIYCAMKISFCRKSYFLLGCDDVIFQRTVNFVFITMRISNLAWHM